MVSAAQPVPVERLRAVRFRIPTVGKCRLSRCNRRQVEGVKALWRLVEDRDPQLVRFVIVSRLQEDLNQSGQAPLRSVNKSLAAQVHTRLTKHIDDSTTWKSLQVSLDALDLGADPPGNAVSFQRVNQRWQERWNRSHAVPIQLADDLLVLGRCRGSMLIID